MRAPISLLLRHSLSTLRPPQVFSLYISNFQFYTILTQFSPKSKNNQLTNLPLVKFYSISKKSILSTNPQVRDNKNEIFFKPSFKDCIFRLFIINPEIIRRFRRVRDLKPEDVLEILVGFEPECEESEVEVVKVKSLWSLFNLVCENCENSKVFEYLPKSYEIMAGMLVRAGLLREIECLFSRMDSKGVLLDSNENEILSNLIEWYVKKGEVAKAVSVYDGMRTRVLVPSVKCCCVLLNCLIEKGDIPLSVRIFIDMEEMGLGLSGEQTGLFENVVLLLCRNGKFKEARALVRRVILSGTRPSNLVLNEIASRYCEKKDYDDLLKFFAEARCKPCLLLGNKMLHSFCNDFGVERASLFLREMENIGFCPNEITYGILIGWSCRERKLKNAFIYLSDILSKSLKPHIRSYNALISGVFREGMWKHAQDILYEMDDRRVLPNYETFKVLLAGYSKARRFDEVKEVIDQMVKSGFVSLSSADDPLSKAFRLLGLDPLSVKLRRDNSVGLLKAEFYDKIGNGLYLETDRTKYEKVVDEVLENTLVPDFNSLMLNNCRKQNFRNSIIIVEEMVKWGQELSFSAFAELIKGLCLVRLSMKTVYSLVERKPNFTNQLNQKTLNLLVQALSERGYINKATTVFEGMSRRNLYINSETYDALDQNNLDEDRMIEKSLVSDKVNYDSVIKQLCRSEKYDKAIELLNIMLKKENIPSSSTYDELIQCCCKRLKLDEALDLIYELLDLNLVPSTKTWDMIIYHACKAGHTIEGEKLFNIMTEIGEKPTREIYCSLIDRYYYEKNLNKASEYMQKMQQNGHEPDFSTHWSLISNLKTKTDENSSKSGRYFLSRLLSNCGFAPKKDFKAKPR